MRGHSFPFSFLFLLLFLLGGGGGNNLAGGVDRHDWRDSPQEHVDQGRQVEDIRRPQAHWEVVCEQLLQPLEQSKVKVEGPRARAVVNKDYPIILHLLPAREKRK